MFKTIPYEKRSGFENDLKAHRLSVSATNIWFQHICLLDIKWKLINRETFVKNYRNILEDIELETPPTDFFKDNEDENAEDPMVIDHEAPEYQKIKDRVLAENIFDILDPMSEAFFALNEDYETAIEVVLDDIYIHWAIFKYIRQIDMIRITRIYTNLTPLIEYVVENVTLKDYQNHIHSKRINDDKVKEYCDDILFGPDQSKVQKFYAEGHGDIPGFDVENLIKRIVSNIDITQDRFIPLGVFFCLSFSITDICKGNMDAPCVKYIRDVLCKV